MNNCKPCHNCKNSTYLGTCVHCVYFPQTANYYEPISPLTSSTEYPPEAEKKIVVNAPKINIKVPKDLLGVITEAYEKNPELWPKGEDDEEEDNPKNNCQPNCKPTELPDLLAKNQIGNYDLAFKINEILAYLKERE